MAASNREAIANIKQLYDTGKISRDEAKRLAQPVLNRVNQRALEIARRHGKSNYPKLDFINAMRNGY